MSEATGVLGSMVAGTITAFVAVQIASRLFGPPKIDVDARAKKIQEMAHEAALQAAAGATKEDVQAVFGTGKAGAMSSEGKDGEDAASKRAGGEEEHVAGRERSDAPRRRNVAGGASTSSKAEGERQREPKGEEKTSDAVAETQETKEMRKIRETMELSRKLVSRMPKSEQDLIKEFLSRDETTFERIAWKLSLLVLFFGFLFVIGFAIFLFNPDTVALAMSRLGSHAEQLKGLGDIYWVGAVENWNNLVVRYGR